MIEKLIEWSLKNRFLVLCATLLIVALGVRAVYLTPVDAIPDLTENQVLVYADWMGRSPQEVENQVTFPLSTGLQGLAGVKEVRATSMFGFSLLTIIFEDGVDTYFARSRVLERMNLLQGQMPEGVTPQLGPDATGLGWVYQYWNDPEREALDDKINAGGKIEPHEIASKTQLFTERYMVDWLLQNSLGPMWLAICKSHGWTPDVEADGTLAALEARRGDWRAKRDSGEVSLTGLMPLHTDAERR